jgi:hypothetical protein
VSGPAYTQTQVAIAILRTGDWAYNVQQTISALVTWFAMEGGAGPQWGISGNTADYNPLNTSLQMPTSGPPYTSVNFNTRVPGPGIQAYTSWEQGIQATVLTLQENQTGYAAIVSVLNNGGTCAQLRAAVIASAWGTGDPPWTASVCGTVPIPPAPPGPSPKSLAGSWVLSGAVVWGG